MQKSESIKEIAMALIKVQSEMKAVGKSATNPFFKSKYAPLDVVMPEALKLLSKHKIAVTQLVGGSQGQSTLTTLLMHESGEWISADQPLLLVKDEPQAQGSAITYARRYAIMSAIGMVADEDDDGQKTYAKPVSKTATPKQVKWIRDTTARAFNLDNEEDIDKTILEILTIPVKTVPLTKVKSAVDLIEKRGKEYRESILAPDVDTKVLTMTEEQLNNAMDSFEADIY